MATRSSLKTITAMALRKESGKFLDQVDFRNQRFLVQRAGKPKAVLISLQEYEQLERQKQVAQDRFWAVTENLRERVAKYDPREVEVAIDEAITAVRQSTGLASAR
jgi:prevent-host-death family protein